VLAIARAARAQVGDYAPETRPRLRFSPQHREWADAQETCVYCGKADPIGPEEHVVSVGLGNYFWGMPPDVVCADCNHGVAAVLDQKLQEHPFIALIRTLTNITGRNGQFASVGASNLTIIRDGPSSLNVRTNNENHVAKTEETFEATLNWQNFGPRQRRLNARAMLKIGLGALWLARGPQETNSERYDHVRDAIQDRRNVPLRGGFGNSPFPSHVLQITVLTAATIEGVSVAFDYFGTRLWALSSGYRNEASDWFLSAEIRNEEPADLLTYLC
jgi:hypothetical protein